MRQFLFMHTDAERKYAAKAARVRCAGVKMDCDSFWGLQKRGNTSTIRK